MARKDVRYRYAQVEDGASDGKAMTLQVAFASEYPVKRVASKRDEKLGIAKAGEEYLELLSHRAADADFSALNNDGALLDEHDDHFQLGKIRHAEVSTDAKSRASIEFDGVTELSKVRYAQMSKRARPHISVGYNVTKFIGDEAIPDGRTAKRVAWEGLEISSVSTPADPSVGSRRSGGEDMFHCTHCGEMFARDDMDDDFRCDNCGPIARSLKKDARKVRAAESGTEFSVNLLSQSVYELACKDERFMGKDNKGNLSGWVSVRDIRAKDEKWFAVIYCSVDGATYQVSLDFDKAGVLSLGEETAVREKFNITYDPIVEDGEERSRAKVDLEQLPNTNPVHADNLATTKRTMADKPTDVLDEKKIRSDITAELEPQIRSRISKESDDQNSKRSSRNKEIHAIANELVKDHGMKWAGEPGKVIVVGERIRAFEQEACDTDLTHTDGEVRLDFKTKCGELIRSARAPKNQENVANLPAEVAGRCSLRRFYNEGIRAADRGQRFNMFMLTDGAEKEAHDEIHNRAKDFPGGADSLGQGMILPLNMPSGIRRNGGRMTRDALASDFATAGAVIEPQFVYPIIDLLRNLPALSRAGMTILSGVMGPLVLPRQEAATTVQSLAEGAQSSAYDQVLGQIKMEPHRVGSKQIYSRLALLQATPDFEAMVMWDHLAQTALYIDAMGINGQGAGDQPLGILNQLGINSVVFGGSAQNAYAKCIAMETAIRAANIYDPVSFISTSKVRGTLRVTPETLTGSTVVSGASNAIWQDGEGSQDGTVIGRTAVDSQQVPGDVLIALVGRHLIMAQWGGLAVVLDTITRADFDEYKLSINTYIDFALRHAQAVSVSAGSLATLS